MSAGISHQNVGWDITPDMSAGISQVILATCRDNEAAANKMRDLPVANKCILLAEYCSSPRAPPRPPAGPARASGI